MSEQRHSYYSFGTAGSQSAVGEDTPYFICGCLHYSSFQVNLLAAMQGRLGDDYLRPHHAHMQLRLWLVWAE